jgi:hypothetical protein
MKKTHLRHEKLWAMLGQGARRNVLNLLIKQQGNWTKNGTQDIEGDHPQAANLRGGSFKQKLNANYNKRSLSPFKCFACALLAGEL